VSFLLERFRDSVSGVVIAALATNDGLPPLGVAGTDRDSSDRLAAIAAGMHALGRGVAVAVGRDGDSRLQQAFIETESERVFCIRAAGGTLLTVVTTLEADPSVTGYEMDVLVKSVRPHLTTPARDEVQHTTGGDR
jgi:predicted regulator of Ras-like GTPase activity (Roadblock/LC7/MglB family)